jgi:16S rRNA processing protein RimM
MLKPDSFVFLVTPDGIKEKKLIRSARIHNKFLVISFRDINDPETASKYRNSLIKVKKSDLPSLKDGEFFYDQIIGLSVFTTDGQLVGIIEEIFDAGSNDVYVVKSGNKEYLIPAIKEVIKKIEHKEKRVVIEVINGLLD